MNNWPKQNYNSMVNFYGEIGTNQTMLTLPYSFKLAWDPKITVKRIKCHRKVAESVYIIFEKTLKVYGLTEIRKLRLDLFGGCFNVRPMRGQNKWSMHSWGVAIDIDPTNNQLKWGRDRASLARPIYNEFWKIVEGEGWTSLGRKRNYDYMHFQACSF